MSLIVKLHKKNDRTTVAVCDCDLVGHLFEENGKQLDLRSDFYKGEELDRQSVGDLIRNADIISLAGKEAIKLGLEEDIIDEDHIITVDGVPHAQAIMMSQQ